MYLYAGIVDRWVDGDTVDVNVDLGFGVWKASQRFRVFGINTPEIRGPEREAGLISAGRVEALAPGGSTVIVNSFSDKKGKYGRWLGDVWFRCPAGVTLPGDVLPAVDHDDPALRWWSVSSVLLAEGLADAVEY